MTDRHLLRRAFLEQAGWAEARVSDLAGDASNRKYFRLSHGDAHAVLMDAPPQAGEDVGPFVRIATFLRNKSFSAPEIIFEDQDTGFLLLEDLGDDLFARFLETQPSMEDELYRAATDVLIALHQIEAPTGLAGYDPAPMARLAGLAFDWYAAGITGADVSQTRSDFVTIFGEQLAQVDGLADVLVQRDYHAENLLWLPEREGLSRVGLLDFQDAVLGHRAYDLVSLLQDARRDVAPEIELAMINRYVEATGVCRASFLTAYALLGLQRNLRIMGVFARLCLRDGKPHYIDLIPRVWAHMTRDLEPLNLDGLDSLLTVSLPYPDSTALQTLRMKCGTIQAQ